MPLFKRNLFRVNEPQKCLLYPSLLACLYGCFLSLLILDYFYIDRDACLHQMSNVFMKQALIGILVASPVFLFVCTVWAYYVSNHTVGPYERIVNDLDRMLKEEQTRELTVRKGDDMFEGLIKRINQLIQNRNS